MNKCIISKLKEVLNRHLQSCKMERYYITSFECYELSIHRFLTGVSVRVERSSPTKEEEYRLYVDGAEIKDGSMAKEVFFLCENEYNRRIVDIDNKKLKSIEDKLEKLLK